MPRKTTGGATLYETSDGLKWRIRYFVDGTRKSRGGYPDEETARFALRLIHKGQLDTTLALSESDARATGTGPTMGRIEKWDPYTATLATFSRSARSPWHLLEFTMHATTRQRRTPRLVAELPNVPSTVGSASSPRDLPALVPLRQDWIRLRRYSARA
jgi:hypothetical protein